MMCCAVRPLMSPLHLLPLHHQQAQLAHNAEQQKQFAEKLERERAKLTGVLVALEGGGIRGLQFARD